MAKKEEKPKKMKRKAYERELGKLEIELVKLQGWIKNKGLKVAVIFEGRDSAGKGGSIKRITRPAQGYDAIDEIEGHRSAPDHGSVRHYRP